MTYGDIAKHAGYPGAARAVGTTVKQNPWAVLIPCHRVVAANGIGGYNSGLDNKRALFMLENISL